MPCVTIEVKSPTPTPTPTPPTPTTNYLIPAAVIGSLILIYYLKTR